MHTRLILLAAGCAICAPAFAGLDAGIVEKVSASIVKVRVVNETRRVATGSAVSIGNGFLVTSCHGLRQARVVQVLVAGTQPTVTRVVKDVERDLCLLATTAAVPPLDLARESEALEAGDFVAAFGFTGPEIRFVEGTVTALHRHQGGEVIQSDAAFRSGESGGALVDRDGRLVGILTFYVPGREDSFFAVPVQWVRELLRQDEQGIAPRAQPDQSFWERADRERPAFLQAAAREYAHDWQGLREIAVHWTQQEPRNPQAWIALGKAEHHFQQNVAAISALKQAIALDARQTAAWFYLGAACRELNESQGLEQALEQLDLLSPKAARALREHGSLD